MPNIIIIVPINYGCKNILNFIVMAIRIKKGMNKQEFDEALRKIKPIKILKATRHLGKVKWNEDALTFQKRMRDE
jgi:hypothetical protein